MRRLNNWYAIWDARTVRKQPLALISSLLQMALLEEPRRWPRVSIEAGQRGGVWVSTSGLCDLDLRARNETTNARRCRDGMRFFISVYETV